MLTSLERRFELLSYAVLLCLAIVPAYHFKAYRISPKVFGVLVAFILLLAFLKHYFFPCQAKVYSVIEFSWLFHLGQASLIIATIFLWKQNASQTYFYFFTTLNVIIASYSKITVLFLIGLLGYTTILILCSIHQTRINKKFLLRYPQFHIVVGIVSFVVAFFVVIFLAVYREELGNWQPFDYETKPRRIGFSPYSHLSSIDLSISTKPILRYYAPSACYYLRGKIFDSYEQGRWYLQEENITSIFATQENSLKFLFILLPSIPAQQTHQLVFLENEGNVIFAPLNAVQVSTTTRYNPLYINQEQAIWGAPNLPTKIGIGVYNTPDIKQKNNLYLTEQEHQRYCNIPKEIQSYFKQLGTSIVGNITNNQEKLQAIYEYLTKNYTYKTSITLSPELDPIISFLEQKQGGHCELFASAFVMLARSQGIPSRYVTGYYAYEWNEWGKFHTVRECDAHAWAEVFMPEKGWQTIETTPSQAVNVALQEYRSIWSTWWETICEFFYRYTENIFDWISNFLYYMIISVVLIVGIIFFSKYPYKQKRKKVLTQKIIPTHFRSCHPQLYQLWQEFVKSIPSAKPRAPEQTLNEWIVAQKPFLSDCKLDYAQQLIQALQEELYSNNPIPLSVILQLSQQWQSVKNSQ